MDSKNKTRFEIILRILNCFDVVNPINELTRLQLIHSWIYSTLPVNKQMLALSATYPEELAEFLKRYMREPTYVRLDATHPSLLGEIDFYARVKN